MIGFFKNIGSYPASLLLIIFSNILLIIGFGIGKLAMWKWENAVKFFAVFTVVMSFLISAYFIGILWFSIGGLISGNIIHSAIFTVFLFLPFIIGHFATYKKIQFYSDIQILTLIISLVVALSFV